eukprot:6490699-Amphidinium_carterae.1
MSQHITSLRRALEEDAAKAAANEAEETNEAIQTPTSATCSKFNIPGMRLRKHPRQDVGNEDVGHKAFVDDADSPTGYCMDRQLEITSHPELDGTFGKSATEVKVPEFELQIDRDHFANNQAFDQDEVAKQVLQTCVGKGYMRAYPTYEAASKALGRDHVLSQFGVLVKRKDNRVKWRVILDAKSSGVTHHTRSDYRVPLAKSEQPYFCGRLDGAVLAYQRTAQGSRNGGLTWAGLGAMRCSLHRIQRITSANANGNYGVEDLKSLIDSHAEQCGLEA